VVTHTFLIIIKNKILVLSGKASALDHISPEENDHPFCNYMFVDKLFMIIANELAKCGQTVWLMHSYSL